MKKLFLLVSIFFVFSKLYSQAPNINSLIQQVEHLKGKEKVMMLSDISYYCSFNDIDLSVEYAQKCLNEARSVGDSLLIAEGYNALAIAFYARSDYETSLMNNLNALSIRIRHGDDYSLISSYSKIGNCYHDMGNFDEAIINYLKSLKIAEDNELVQQVGLINNNIAEIFKEQQNYEKASEYYHKAIGIASQQKDTLGLANATTNLGIVKMRQGKLNEADSLYLKAQKLVVGKGFLDLEAGIYINFGVLYKEEGKYRESILAYQRAKEIYEETGEVHGLAIVYSNLGNSFLEDGKNDSALIYYQNGVQLARQTSSLTRMQYAYESLSNYYMLTNNYKNAYTYDSIADVLRDSVYNVETSKIIEELNTKYETEKKEKQLAEQNIEIARQELKVQQKNNQLISLSGGLFSLIVVAFFVYRDQKSKQEKLQQQVALEKVEALNKLQNEKLRISRDLHDNIGSQLTFMVSSLDNLKYITNKNMQDDKLLQLGEFTKETMVQLRETIWALNAETISFDQLATRIAGFLNQAKQASPEIHFETSIKSCSKIFDSKEAINIYRTIQEAVNNAIKHAEATVIVFGADEYKFSVSDNGKGFDMNTVTKGNGLINMESRVREAGFRTNIIPKPGEGVEVNILLT